MLEKCKEYGINVRIASYFDLISGQLTGIDKPIFIDELENFVVHGLNNNIKGYSIGIDNEIKWWDYHENN